MKLVIILVIPTVLTEMIKVLSTNENLPKLVEGTGAYLKNPPNVSLIAITVCFRFFDYLRYDRMIIGGPDLWIKDQLFEAELYDTWFGFLRSSTPIKPSWAPKQWNHVCFSFASHFGQVTIVSNAMLVL